MKNCVKRILAMGLALGVCVTCLSLCMLLPVDAHSGRTDSRGGHHDYKNASGLGSYHYHHGYPAHLHENGICPYESAAQPQPSSPDLAPAVQPYVDTEPVTVQTVDYSLVFDASFYAAANPDVAAVLGTDPSVLFQHFLTSGMREGRQGNETFNVWTYRAQNPDLAAVFGDDLPQYYIWYCTVNG